MIIAALAIEMTEAQITEVVEETEETIDRDGHPVKTEGIAQVNSACEGEITHAVFSVPVL